MWPLRNRWCTSETLTLHGDSTPLNHMRSLNVSCLVGQGKTKYLPPSGISVAACMVILIDQAESNKRMTNVATHKQHFFFFFLIVAGSVWMFVCSLMCADKMPTSRINTHLSNHLYLVNTHKQTNSKQSPISLANGQAVHMFK